MKKKGLIVGDMHRHIDRAVDVFDIVEGMGYDYVFQVGDYGWYPRTDAGVHFLRATVSGVQRTGVPFYWLPGNHEDWEAIDAAIEQGIRTDDGFVIIADGVYMVPRSLSWNWEGVEFGAIGGAFSIDKALRTKFVDWFPQENATWSDLDNIKRGRRVLLTHDAPVNLARQLGWQELDFHDEGLITREVIEAAIKWGKPTTLVHGHWHIRMDYRYTTVDNHTVRCVALNHVNSGMATDGLADIYYGKVTPWVHRDISF